MLQDGCFLVFRGLAHNTQHNLSINSDPSMHFCSFVTMVLKKKSNHWVLLLFSDIANQFDALLVVVEN